MNEESKQMRTDARKRKSYDYKETKTLLGRMYKNVTRTTAKTDGTSSIPEYESHPRFEIFRKNCEDFRMKWEEAQRVSGTLSDLKTRQELERLPPKLKSMVKMLAYLGLVESLGATLVDMVLILLIADGREVHVRWPGVKHVTKADELEKVELAYKLDFLEAEELDIFKKFLNRKLRNTIAHLKFTIEENGYIKKKNKKQTLINIDDEIRKFWDGVGVLKQIFDEIGYEDMFKARASAQVANTMGNKA